MNDTEVFDLEITVPEEYKTFGGWKRIGRHVVKGAKAGWFAGVPMFHVSDTERDCAYTPRRGVYDAEPRRWRDDSDAMPSDSGSEVCDIHGRVTGTRGYTQFNGGAWVPVTYHSDGSSTVHCGGPCGDLYVDEFGNT